MNGVYQNMTNAGKKIRTFSLVAPTATELDDRASFIFNKVENNEAITGVEIGQTYRTYESRVAANGKKFSNTPFFTNSLTLHFDETIASEEINKIVADIRNQFVGTFGKEKTI